MSGERFKDLPIIIEHEQVKPGGWSRYVDRETTVAELLETWDIDEPNPACVVVQLLRHLRWACGHLEPGALESVDGMAVARGEAIE